MDTGLMEKNIMSAVSEDGPCVRMVWSDAESFLEAWTAQGRTAGSLSRYRRALRILYDFLPKEKLIRRGTLAQWQEQLLLSGYSGSAVNVMLTACNQFMEYIGHGEYRAPNRLPAENNPQPELTRGEYQRILSTAKALGNERGYFLVKTFVCTGLHVLEIPFVTVENVRMGRFTAVCQGTKRIIRVPECLRQELLAYADRAGILSGQIFVAKNGKPLHRSRITDTIKSLCEEAQVPQEKGNPRCLRKLYLTTWTGVELSFQLLMEQTLDRQLEQEQLTLGWET